VACGDDDAPAQTHRTDGIGQHGRGHGLLPQHGLDAVGHQHARRGQRKDVGIFAGIVGNGDGVRRLALENRLRQALRGARDGIDIHAGGADAQHRAQTARAEGHLTGKGLHGLLLVLCIQFLQHLGIIFREVFAPARSFFLPHD